MRRSFGLTPLPALVCAAALSTAVPGCDQTTYAQATGYVKPYVDTFEPRQLVVEFVDAVDLAAAQAIVDGVSTGAIVTDYNDVTLVGLVETPPGYSLDEISAGLEALTSDVTYAMPNYILYADTFGTHMLMSEDGTREVAWLRERGVDLQALACEFVVRVHGTREGVTPDGVSIMDVESVEIVGDRVVQKGGALTLVDRSGDGLGTVVILADDLRDEAWELVGDSALVSEIIALGADTFISVTGTESPPSLLSRAGGLSLTALSYADLTAGEDAVRTLLTDTVLSKLVPIPDPGDKVFFLPIELAAGAVASIPAEFDLPAETSTLDANGYLVFVDYDPALPWPHTAQIVFVKTADATTPVVLFNDRPLTSLRVKDAAGEVVNGPWVAY